jgi:hypothetical protein
MIRLILVALLTVSCDLFTTNGVNISSKEIEITSQSLAGTQWELVSIEVTEQGPLGREAGVYAVPDDEYYNIDFKEFGLKGRMFCNTCGGRYEITPPDSISIAWICTRASCGWSAGIQSLIATSKKIKLTQYELVLFFESVLEGKGSLYFKKMDVE